jgi:hypothetical protein
MLLDAVKDVAVMMNESPKHMLFILTPRSCRNSIASCSSNMLSRNPSPVEWIRYGSTSYSAVSKSEPSISAILQTYIQHSLVWPFGLPDYIQ